MPGSDVRRLPASAEIVSYLVWLYFRFPRHHGEPRNGAAMGAEDRPGDREVPAPPRAAAGRQISPRRGRPHHCRHDARRVAGRRSGHPRTQCPGAEPARRRERQLKRCRPARQARRFLSIHDPIANRFHLNRDHRRAIEVWADITEAKPAV